MSKQETILNAFKTEVCEKSHIIDSEEELDWYALSIGFFLAKGCTADEAKDLALKARYDHGYWC